MSDTDRINPATVRGDREGRRRDVLTAASEILDESGWDGFSIRTVASRAGVSSGAVYQWFSGKNEIFGELYDEEIRGGVSIMDAVPDDILLSDLVRMLLDWAVGLYDVLGRHELEFVGDDDEGNGRDAAPTMAPIYERLGEQSDELFSRAAKNEGVTLVESEYRLIWFWAGCNGTAERLTVLPRYASGEKREELLQFAAASLTRSLTL